MYAKYLKRKSNIGPIKNIGLVSWIKPSISNINSPSKVFLNLRLGFICV